MKTLRCDCGTTLNVPGDVSTAAKYVCRNCAPKPVTFGDALPLDLRNAQDDAALVSRITGGRA